MLLILRKIEAIAKMITRLQASELALVAIITPAAIAAPVRLDPEADTVQLDDVPNLIMLLFAHPRPPDKSTHP